MKRILLLTVVVVVAYVNVANSVPLLDLIIAEATPTASNALLSPCSEASTTTPQSTPASDETFTRGLPRGIAVSLMASGLIETLPAEPAQLLLSRLTLPPGADADTFIAAGPILYYAMEGTTSVFLDGERESLVPGEAWMVQLGDQYTLRNDNDVPATLLRLATTGRDEGDVHVAREIKATETPRPRVPPILDELIRRDVNALPEAPATLFITCMRWDATHADLGSRRHPGPVGLYVEQGILLVDDRATLFASDIALFQAEEYHRIRTQTAPTSVLLFGVIAAGEDLWQAGDNSSRTAPTGQTVGTIRIWPAQPAMEVSRRRIGLCAPDVVPNLWRSLLG